MDIIGGVGNIMCDEMRCDKRIDDFVTSAASAGYCPDITEAMTVALDHPDVLIINILRQWDRGKIEAFAKRLLGERKGPGYRLRGQ